uniref:Uncharacterized protein n=1 Tax=Romanomermis culicivorax TaxID=13658 RepID=A0A915KSB9_ROMCU
MYRVLGAKQDPKSTDHSVGPEPGTYMQLYESQFANCRDLFANRKQPSSSESARGRSCVNFH